MAGGMLLSILLACNQPNKTETPATPTPPPETDMKALYEKNLQSLKTGISAFEKRDLDGWAATVADSAKWNSAAYGSTVAKKDDWKKALSGYLANWDSLHLAYSNFLPGIDSTTQANDGSVRYYGVWAGKHKSGAWTKVKFYATYDFNKDNKVVSANEYFDLGGLMNAVSGLK